MAEESSDESRPLLNGDQTKAGPSDGSALKGVMQHQTQTYGLSKCTRRGACGAILLSVMFERLTFYGISSNMVLFLNGTPFSWKAYDAAGAILLFLGISYAFSVVGGLIADTLLGRFKTIMLSFVIYIIGSIILVMIGYVSLDDKEKFGNFFCNGTRAQQGSNYCSWAVYVSLITLAIGSGAVRVNMPPFGGDQVRFEGPEIMRMFFNWFYWAINVGSLIAMAGITTLQQNLNFFYGFLVPLGSLVLAAGIFLVGRTWYLSRKPMGSVLTNTMKIIFEAFRKRRMRETVNARPDSSQLLSSQPKPSFLDMAKVRFGGSFHESMVDDVKSLKKIILVFLGLTPYWVVYFQMQTTFLIQGLSMRFSPDYNKTDHVHPAIKFQIPIAWLSLFDIIAVILLLPFLDRIIYPWLDRHGVNFTLLRRMTLGMVFSILAMITAGVLEHVRLEWAHDPSHQMINQTIGNTTYIGADIWVFWQIPQYTLIGFSEVFASVAGLEFAYAMAPRSMQGLIMGLYYSTIGLAALLGGAILKVTTLPSINWLIGNPYKGRLDLYFYMLAVGQAVALIVFAAVTLVHESKERRQRAGMVINRQGTEERTLTGT
ncbi:solute carrier family 15 member 4-like [Asterias amurensis]|uniref:solute carrier family 15 member 4-like n=1 Tax=Asterias amurensis TaxID=7602 RepID=UPI003AB6D7D0